MYLSNIKLWNFRKYGPSTFPFDETSPNLDLDFHKGLNVLIGANDSGKTAILDAIKLVLKTNTGEWVRVDKDEDFFGGTKNIKIQLRLDGFSEDEARHFAEFLSFEGEGEDIKEYLILSCEISKNAERAFSFDVKAGPNGDLGILTAEQREYLNVTYLKPLRDVKTEFIPKKGSRLSTILESHEAFKGRGDAHCLMSIFRDFNLSVEKYFEGLDKNGVALKDLNGKALKGKIDEFIKDFLSKNDEGNFGVNPGELKNILEKLELTLKDNINPGLGTLNRLFIASELLHLQRQKYDGLELGLIEEIEAHIHPQAQMKVIESLQNKLGGTKAQLIITTHSPNLASKLKLEDLIICHGNNAFPMGRNYTNLDQGGDDLNYKFLERFLDVTKSNLFFSEGVIFVEGWAEEIILPSFARLLKKLGVVKRDLTDAQVSIVNVGSDSFFRYAKIFERRTPPNMSRRIAIVTDIDLKPEAYANNPKIQNEISGKDEGEQKSILKKHGIISAYTTTEINDERNKKAINVQNIKTFLTDDDKWTLEYSLGLFPKFQAPLFDSIKKGIQDMRASTTYSRSEETRNFPEIMGSDQEKAFEMYHGIMLEKSVSKPIVAQYFSEFLEKEIDKIKRETSTFSKEDFTDSSSVSYLVKAIKYVIGE